MWQLTRLLKLFSDTHKTMPNRYIFSQREGTADEKERWPLENIIIFLDILIIYSELRLNMMNIWCAGRGDLGVL